MEKKIRVTLPRKIVEILENDIEEFFIKKNTLLNYIYAEKIKENQQKKFVYPYKGETSVIQFNLNKKNLEGYYNFLEENNIQNESEFFREILIEYASLGKKKREYFLFKDIVERINYSIKEKRIIKIVFRDEKNIEVEPYLIESSKLEVMNYLFCYNLREAKWKNYKIKYIKSIYIKNTSFKLRDKEFIDKMKENFDPFISFGQYIKIKLTTAGKKIFNEIETNRPQIIKIDKDEYILECSHEKAKRYFSFFLDEVEILEPLELRTWFKEKYRKALIKYE
ncbi:WYL domain-containing protein [Cetobacterium somerae]|uniref:WYL domain-containing protein n=1 Tax=Cetobacterium somerae TaxID=188913 RepID=UPI001F06C02C|nr:WYL domain-containing protein [Cetobacterium somerae]UPO96635.1 WYL domain-containing protein [Cetobacterium somerae]